MQTCSYWFWECLRVSLNACYIHTYVSTRMGWVEDNHSQVFTAQHLLANPDLVKNRASCTVPFANRNWRERNANVCLLAVYMSGRKLACMPSMYVCRVHTCSGAESRPSRSHVSPRWVGEVRLNTINVTNCVVGASQEGLSRLSIGRQYHARCFLKEWKIHGAFRLLIGRIKSHV
jgi:hypothetical protein